MITKDNYDYDRYYPECLKIGKQCCETKDYIYNCNNANVAPLTLVNALDLLSSCSSFITSRRMSRHQEFKQFMLAGLSNQPALTHLSTRDDNDFSIALLDAMATVADVLCFYTERIIKEGNLKTATEQISIIQLARMVGYELNPGISASAYLAFTVDENVGSNQKKAAVPRSTKVQSIPEQGQVPQVFETDGDTEVRALWNELTPNLSRPQEITYDTNTFCFVGTDTQLKPGDGLLIVFDHDDGDNDRADDGDGNNQKYSGYKFSVISSINVSVALNMTRVDTRTRTETKYRPRGETLASSQTNDLESFVSKVIRDVLSVFGRDANLDQVMSVLDKYSNLTQQDLVSISIEQGIPREEFFATYNLKAREHAVPKKPAVFCFQIKAPLYGHNAPLFEALPAEIQGQLKGLTPSQEWHENTLGTDLLSSWIGNREFLYLDNHYSGMVRDSWIVLDGNTIEDGIDVDADTDTDDEHTTLAFKISNIDERTLPYFLLNTKVTGLSLHDNATSSNMPNFRLRETIVYAQSKLLRLADFIPIDESELNDPNDQHSFGSKTVTLDQVVDGLTVGQPVTVTGILQGTLDRVKTEVASMASIKLFDDKYHSQIEFESPLQNRIKPSTIKLNANVSLATHGDTKQELLGSGDASISGMEFILSNKPLTYLSASTRNGTKSTLKVYVNGVQWSEAYDLSNLGPNDYAYTVRRTDSGDIRIIFGSGTNGARPMTGLDNIEAIYRTGTGYDGLVKEDQLKLIMNRPLGVKEVVNPTSSFHADNSEGLEHARRNAPLNVKTMGRIISVADFENFTISFAGIGKANAIYLWNGEKTIVHITIGSSLGETIGSESPLYKNLEQAINGRKAPRISFTLDTFDLRLFNLEVNVLIRSGLQPDAIKSKIEVMLREKFSYEGREFGQCITKTEVIISIQQIDGVLNTELRYLYRSGETKELQESISSDLAHWDSETRQIARSELLIIHPESDLDAVRVNITTLGVCAT